MKGAHTALVNACISYINARGGFAWKNQSGRLPVGQRYVYVGKAGLPDVIGVLPSTVVPGHVCEMPDCKFTWRGRLIAVEVKTGLGRVSKRQAEMHEALRKRGALVIVARSIVDVEKELA